MLAKLFLRSFVRCATQANVSCSVCAEWSDTQQYVTGKQTYVQGSGCEQKSDIVCKRGVSSQEKGDVTHVTQSASLYVHWPYCLQRCTYCNFNKYIPNKDVDYSRLERCFLTETETLLHQSGVTNITSIFFGGGTPSLAPAHTIHAIINKVSELCHLTKNAEITLEANPTALETTKLREFKAAGVNRLSVGVQALNEKDLKILGRDHSVEDATRCVHEARQLFPGRVSVDLIFGRPDQTVQSWITELSQVLSLCDDHISLYQLTLERGTQLFKKWKAGELKVPSHDETAEMYSKAVEILEKSGYLRYEVSNFAQEKAESSHNMSYWQGRQYIGVGPGAHGRFVPADSSIREVRIQTLEPLFWTYEVEKYGHATRKKVPLSPMQQAQELLMLGLRTRHGLLYQHWKCHFPDTDLKTLLCGDACVQDLIKNDLLVINDRSVRASYHGMMVLDSLLPDILNAVERIFSQFDNGG